MMDNNSLYISIFSFIGILVLLVLLRIKSKNKIDIRNTDVLLALMPVALWLFLSGQIKEFSFGDLKIVSAIEEASASPVSAQVTKLPVEMIQTDGKAGVQKIPELIFRKTQALSFQLGHGGYWGVAIEEYFRRLTKFPFFKYVVINNEKGEFFGLADAQQVGAVFRGGGDFSVADFAKWLNESNKNEVKRLPGFVGLESTLRKKSNKQKALQLMDSLDVETLPVIGDNNQFVGVVERSKLAASILIDITERLEVGKKKK